MLEEKDAWQQLGGICSVWQASPALFGGEALRTLVGAWADFDFIAPKSKRSSGHAHESANFNG